MMNIQTLQSHDELSEKSYQENNKPPKKYVNRETNLEVKTLATQTEEITQDRMD